MKQSKRKTLPRFGSEAEEHDFWSRHALADYLDDFKSADVAVDPKLARRIRERTRKKHIVAVRLDDEEYSRSQKLALKKGFGLSTLIRSWIAEGLLRDLKSA